MAEYARSAGMLRCPVLIVAAPLSDALVVVPDAPDAWLDPAVRTAASRIDGSASERKLEEMLVDA